MFVSDILFVMAVIPVVFLCWFIYSKDTHKEPMGLLMKIFFLGVGTVIPILICEIILDGFFPTDNVDSFLLLFINMFLSVAMVEEGFKWLVTKFIGYNGKEFDEIYDIIVYAVFASLGFACLENIMYVFSYGFGNAISRAILSIPGHACFGTAMGLFFAKAKLASVNNNQSLYTTNLVLSIIVPALLHTTYNSLLTSGVPLVVFLTFDIAMVVVCVIQVNKMSKMQITFSNNVSSGNITYSNGSVQYTGPVLNVPKNEVNNTNVVNNNVSNNVNAVNVANTPQTAQPQVSNASQIPVLGQGSNFCPVCGSKNHGGNFCPSCGYKYN